VIPFHRLLISTAIVFCAGFAIWAGWNYRQSGDAWTLLMGLAFGVAALALAYYLRHLSRFLGR
jgi:4-amino-4-deoxy-L-arabinose transferase-like glycosyltransferase